MAIEPAGIIQALQTITQNDNINDKMSQIFVQLPTCIQRAIATLQCTQLEKEYKELATKLKLQNDFDLPQWIRDTIEQIVTRKR